MVPPSVQLALRKLLSDNEGEKSQGLKLAPGLSALELPMLLDLLKQEAEHHSDRLAPVGALYKLAIQKVSGAGAKFPQNISELAQNEPQLRDAATVALKEIAAQSTTKAGKAASKALESMQKKK
jgi:hypothetical protein